MNWIWHSSGGGDTKKKTRTPRLLDTHWIAMCINRTHCLTLIFGNASFFFRMHIIISEKMNYLLNKGKWLNCTVVFSQKYFSKIHLHQVESFCHSYSHNNTLRRFHFYVSLILKLLMFWSKTWTGLTSINNNCFQKFALQPAEKNQLSFILVKNYQAFF